jgi:membrane protein DedA with SNARE-associated domain
MRDVLDWLASLPPALLYLSVGSFAAVENIFPPIPADVVVAFGAFLAARGHGTAAGAFLSTWCGNLAGAMLMYAVGRRYGAHRVAQRLAGGEASEGRLSAWYGRYGVAALVVCRFLPGVRALVPPFAGALRVPVGLAALAIGGASGVWYGLVTYLAFRVGANWAAFSDALVSWQRGAAIAALVAAAVVAGTYGALRWRRSRDAR